LRRSTRTDVVNSLLIGFPTGLRLESGNSENAFLTDATLKLNNNIVAGMTKNIDSTSTNYNAVKTLFESKNEYKTLADLKVSSLSNDKPEPLPTAGSPLLTGSSFAGMPAFFEAVAYRGAFGSENWTKCWCEFDPQNADYSSTPLQYFQDPGDPGTIVTGGNSVAFTAPVGANLTYSWDFGVSGISTDVSTDVNPTYVYQTKGTYTVTLTITNARGCVLVKTKQVDVTVSTNEIKEVSQFDLYPNPVSEQLVIEINSTDNFDAQYRIVQANGSILKVINNPITQGSNNTIVPVSELTSGYYILQLISDKGMITKKFVVKH
ncbi:MAG: PKD domain-containing protein, partial [Saprospiraceae bacterium]|nr:PKD domain-containing protein [Saprospiraceae bacterium]